MLVDTHCHLDDPSLSRRLPQVMEAARGAGVHHFVVPGVSPDGWPLIATLAGQIPEILPAFGLHPMHACVFNSALLDELAEFSAKSAAIGEIGLDYLLVDAPRETQITSFRRQLQLAVQMGLPVLVHCRHAFGDLLRILREERVGRVGGVMHAFSGSPETARECIALGLAIGVAGPITYRNAVRPLEVVRKIALEHLLLETDAPDLTPEPYRGRPNEPAFLLSIAEKVADIKGADLEEIAATTSANASKLFKLPWHKT
jgi:TatD DNase family protein